MSSNNVSIASVSNNSARLTVNNFVDGQSFSISVRLSQCGQTRWLSKTVVMDQNCTGPGCAPISEAGPATESEGTVTTDATATAAPVTDAVKNATLSLPVAAGRLYPNPVISGAPLRLSGLPAAYTLTLRDQTGRLLRKIDGNTTDRTITTNDLSPGLYLLTVADQQSGTVDTHKVIVR